MIAVLCRGVVLCVAVCLFPGCGPPKPATAVNNAPPPPPPAAVPEPKPAPQPAKPVDDPHTKLMREVQTAVDRYVALFPEVKDEATAEKAAEEIARLTARMHELAIELSKIPYEPKQDLQMHALQAQLSNLSISRVSNAEMQRVLSNPDFALLMTPASLNFFGAVAAVAQADGTRRLNDLRIPAQAAPGKQEPARSPAPGTP